MLAIRRTNDAYLIFYSYVGNVDYYDMAGLDADTDYDYYVFAYNECGQSGWSNQIYLTTLSATTTTTTTTAAPTTTTTTAAPITITCSQGALGITWEWNNKDYFDLYITPETMNWTATLNDTGEGTNWVSINPATGTGSKYDPNIYANADAPNRDPVPRSCTVTFSDDASEAEDLVLTVTQMANPS